MHDPRDRAPVPAPHNLFPSQRGTLFEDAKRTLRWDVLDAYKVSNCLSNRVLDDPMLILDLKDVRRGFLSINRLFDSQENSDTEPADTKVRSPLSQNEVRTPSNTAVQSVHFRLLFFCPSHPVTGFFL